MTYANTRFVRALKQTLGCCDCGVAGPADLLDFDHRPGEVKIDKVSRLVNRRVSMARLLAEIDKCDVRCRSCHAKRHMAEPGRAQHAAAHSVGVPRPRRRRYDHDEARRLVGQGVSRKEVARRFGVDPAAISRAVRA